MSTQMLPLDIQLLIIERLPVKSLLRFRSVCKPWKSFISSSRFIAGYTTHSQQQHLIISYKNHHDEVKCVSVFDKDDQTFALTVPPLVQGTRVLDSSHGLVCMVDSRRSETDMAVLWNPAIRRSIAVAVPNLVDPPQHFRYVVAFGVCPATMDPKLLKITFIKYEELMENIIRIPFQVMVFTLSSGQWTTPPSTTTLPRKSIQFDDFYHTVIGQFIYMVGYDSSAVDSCVRNMIMSFDLSTHEFGEVDIPKNLRDSTSLGISRLRESLVFLEYDEINPNPQQVCHVWMMMDDGDSKMFTKLFTINPPNTYVWQTLGFRESGEPIIEWTHDVNAMDIPSALAVYEPGSRDIKDLGIQGNSYSFYGSSYMESLLLLDHEDGRIIRC